MAKTITAGMTTHLAGSVTTLASIWRITRRDGVRLFFTDHDANLTFDGNTYVSTSGYERTAMASNAQLSVDNLDVRGFYATAGVAETDLRTGLYDFAEVEIAIVDWTDPDTNGEIAGKKGRLGEVTLSNQGFYSAEIRGLTQLLTQNLLPIFQSECRVDLGSPECGVPILPPILGRNQSVLLGEFYRVPVGSGTVTVEGLLDGSFEVDSPGTSVSSMTHWNQTGNVGIQTTNNGLNPDDGDQFLDGGGNLSSVEVNQDVEIEPLGFTTADIDAGSVSVEVTSRRANSAASDTGRIIIEALDSGLSLVSTLYDTTAEVISPEDTWVDRNLASTVLPSTTRYVRYRYIMQRVSGFESTSSLDNVSMQVTGPAFAVYSTPLTNGGFEDDSTGTYNAGTPPTGWTVDSNSFDISGTISGLAPQEGSNLLIGTSGVDTAEMHQDITLASEGFDATTVDSTGVNADFSIYRANASTTADTGRVRVQFLDASDVLISTPMDTGLEAITPQDTWVVRTMGQTRLPIGTRKIRIILDYDRFSGSGQSLAAFDGGVLTLTNELQLTYGNLVYEVTTAGITAATLPTYDTDIGDPTTDGNAVLTARDAYMRDAIVATATNRRVFTITVDEARAVDGWFKAGAVEFQTGDNAGKVVEVKEWTQSSSTVELFLPVPFAIQVGDRLRLYRGCLKRLDDDCVDEFDNAINYRGEPFVPGNRQLIKGPSNQ